MAKWFAITLITLLGFMTILLGLGYLLSENEKSTTRLKNQLEQQAQLEKQRKEQSNALDNYTKIITTDSDSQISSKHSETLSMKTFEEIYLNNLTCITVAQCKVVTVKFKNNVCQLASNIIGVSQLKKIPTHTLTMDTCPIIGSESQLSCQKNLCTLH